MHGQPHIRRTDQLRPGLFTEITLPYFAYMRHGAQLEGFLSRIWGGMLQYIPTSADNKYIVIYPPLCLPTVHLPVSLKAELCGHSTLRR